MLTKLKQTATQFRSIKPGDTFYFEGEVCIRINSGQHMNAINMQGTGILFHESTPVVRVQPVAVEGNTVIFEEVSVTLPSDCACEFLTLKPCE